MVSRAVEKRIYEIYNHYCAICGKYTPFDEGEVDHIKPKTKGGTDSPENLQWLCHRCNKLKGNKRTNREVTKLLGLPYPLPTPTPTPTPTPVIPEFNINVISNYDTKLTKETFQTYTDCELLDWFMIDFCCAFKGTEETGHAVPSFCLVIQNTGNTRIKNLKVDAEVRIIGCDQDGKPWRTSPPNYDLWSYFFNARNGVILNKNPSTYEADEVISIEPMGAVSYVVLPTAQELGKGLHRMEIDLYVYSHDPPLSWHKIVYYVIERKI